MAAVTGPSGVDPTGVAGRLDGSADPSGAAEVSGDSCPYRRLGLVDGATLGEVRIHFRKLLRSHRKDLDGWDPGAMRSLTDVYEKLCADLERAELDKIRADDRERLAHESERRAAEINKIRAVELERLANESRLFLVPAERRAAEQQATQYSPEDEEKLRAHNRPRMSVCHYRGADLLACIGATNVWLLCNTLNIRTVLADTAWHVAMNMANRLCRDYTCDVLREVFDRISATAPQTWPEDDQCFFDPKLLAGCHKFWRLQPGSWTHVSRDSVSAGIVQILADQQPAAAIATCLPITSPLVLNDVAFCPMGHATGHLDATRRSSHDSSPLPWSPSPSPLPSPSSSASP